MLLLSTPPPIAAPAPSPSMCPSGGPATRDAVATHVVPPEWPSGWTIDDQVTITVAMDIDKAGKVRQATVVQRSANLDNADAQASFDKAAITAAINAQFSPKIVNCVAVSSHYLFKTTFDPRR